MRSGDVVVMGGRSRVCYHGVPRILDERPNFLIPGHAESIAVADALNAELSPVPRAAATDPDSRKPIESPHNHDSGMDAAEHALLLQYLSTCRLNINMRQVRDLECLRVQAQGALEQAAATAATTLSAPAV